MKNPAYQSKKWNQVIAHLLEGEKIMGMGYQHEISELTEECAKSSDYFRLCVCIANTYDLWAWEYLAIGNQEKVIQTTCMAVKSFFYACRMKKAEIPTKQIYTNIFSRMEDYICKAITTGCFDEFSDCYEDTVMGSLYLGEKEKAKKLVEQLPEIDEKRPEVYYIKPQFLKGIYNALLNQNEELLKEELVKRVKKYRKNMTSYATVIDFTTIGLLKTAKRYGMNVELDIAETPAFLKEDIDMEHFSALKIPFQDEMEKILKK